MNKATLLTVMLLVTAVLMNTIHAFIHDKHFVEISSEVWFCGGVAFCSGRTILHGRGAEGVEKLHVLMAGRQSGYWGTQ